MLTYRRTSIFESSAQTVVNTVNCVGIMGKGIAATFKHRHPDMFDRYVELCRNGAMEVGKLWLWKTSSQWVLNFPTKQHWRNPSRIESVEKGLQKFVQEYERHGIHEISFPRLGCGNGGLYWENVRPLMEFYLSPLPIKIYVHDYAISPSLPEHLESSTKLIHQSIGAKFTFTDFLTEARKVLSNVGERLIDLDSHIPFEAIIDSSNEISIFYDKKIYQIDYEELRNIWMSLAKGLLTSESLRWSVGDAAIPLISLIAHMQGVRAIQIQRHNANEPEMALELVRNIAVSDNVSELELLPQHHHQLL